MGKVLATSFAIACSLVTDASAQLWNLDSGPIAGGRLVRISCLGQSRWVHPATFCGPWWGVVT